MDEQQIEQPISDEDKNRLRVMADKLEEIAKTKKELAEIEEKTKSEMLAIMNEIHLVTVRFPCVTVSKQVRKTWEYTKAIEFKEEALKEAKKQEQESGLATCKETESIVIRTK